MPLKIVRNDITKMETEAIVNTANKEPVVGRGCDSAIYKAAGFEELLSYRKKNVGIVPVGSVFITPGFNLKAKYIIHAVSPLYKGGLSGEETILRGLYRKCLETAVENNIKSISFPLISTGSFGYPKEEGLRIAVDEIYSFLLDHEIEVFLVVFDNRSTGIASKLSSSIDEYIDENYVDEKSSIEYGWPSSHDLKEAGDVISDLSDIEDSADFEMNLEDESGEELPFSGARKISSIPISKSAREDRSYPARRSKINLSSDVIKEAGAIISSSGDREESADSEISPEDESDLPPKPSNAFINSKRKAAGAPELLSNANAEISPEDESDLPPKPSNAFTNSKRKAAGAPDLLSNVNAVKKSRKASNPPSNISHTKKSLKRPADNAAAYSSNSLSNISHTRERSNRPVDNEAAYSSNSISNISHTKKSIKKPADNEATVHDWKIKESFDVQSNNRDWNFQESSDIHINDEDIHPRKSFVALNYDEDYDNLQKKLSERLSHRSDSFSEYLLFLIKQKGLTNADVYKKAVVDKKVFSKIKNNPKYHPTKMTALCLCVGARLNLDEAKDLLSRAGYALSPCDKTDIIFSYFIENGIYDMIELDIQLEEHGLPCMID